MCYLVVESTEIPILFNGPFANRTLLENDLRTKVVLCFVPKASLFIFINVFNRCCYWN